MSGPSYSKIASAAEGVREAKTSVGLWSRLSFAWLSGIFALGNLRSLDETDLFKAVDQRDAQEISAEIIELWTEETKTSNNPRLWKSLARLFSAWEYILHTCSLILLSCLLVSQPLFLNFLLRELSSDSSSTGWICFFIAGLSLSGIIKPFLKSSYQYAAAVVATHVNTAITGLVYRKVLTSLRADRLGELTSSHVINIISKDQLSIHYAVRYIPLAITGTMQLILVTLILWKFVALEAVSGISCIFLVFVFKTFMKPVLNKLQGKSALLTDERMSTVCDVISNIRVVKMNAWEKTFEDIVGETRRHEIFVIGQKLGIQAVFIALQSSAATVATLVSVATMIVRGHVLTAADVFTIYTLMSAISQSALKNLAYAVRFLADSSVTLKKVESLLLDFSENSSNVLTSSSKKVCDKKALAKRKQSDAPDSKTPLLVLDNVTCKGADNTLLLDDVTVNFHGNQLIVITGPVGSGKSSLLSAILGELQANRGHTYHNGSIAYCPQTPWLFTGAVSQNILFGRNLEELKFQQTIEACALKMDFELLPEGDRTLIGERGVSLSGGQQSRINLARAVYSEADIYLLDDPLSAVDAKVGRHIFDRCILKHLGNTLRVLVTHRVEYLKQADCIVVMHNGRVQCQGKYEELLTSDEYFSDLIRIVEKEQTPSEVEEEAHKRKARHVGSSDELCETEGFQIVEEDRDIGSVSGETYWTYIKSGIPLPFLVVVVAVLFLPEATSIGANTWLAKWTELSPVDQRKSINFWIYTALSLGTFVLSFVRAFVLLICAMRAAEKLHSRMLVGLLMAPVRFFDTNPSGRILNRFARSVVEMDEFLTIAGLEFLRYLAAVCSSVLLVSVVNPWLILANVPFVTSLTWLTVYSLRTSRELKRLEATSCSPLYAHVAETIGGVAVIRASSMEESLIESMFRYRDKGNSSWLFFNASKQWVCLRTEVLAALFLTLVAFVLVFTDTEKAMVGLSISYTLDVSQRVYSLLSEFANVENFMTSVERVISYCNLEPEPGYQFDGKVPDGWPENGSISFKNTCFRYYPGGPQILKDVNLHVHKGERIGIVGRTGAGKSSLIATIFRMPEPEGDILIDDIAIKTLNLQCSRSVIAAISQNPLLFMGSLRFNLDPEDKYADKALWDVLQDVSLKQLVRHLPGKLKSRVTEGGGNFSVGERQLICVARALLQNKKIVVLDEATANVDMKTDRLLQEVIRSKLRGRTVLTIAHRLETILDYDRVLVMDSGKVVEFDSPKILLARQDGEFARLYHCSLRH